MSDRLRCGRRAWNPEDDALLVARYPHETAAAIARDLRRTRTAINSRARTIGLRKNAVYLRGRRAWTPEDDALLVARYPHESTASVARALNRSPYAINGRVMELGLKKTAEYMASPAACRLRRGDNVGAPFRFPKGHVPANKGLRRPGWSPGRMRQTQFKKGQKTANHMPVGSTRLCDGYVYRKVSDIPGVAHTRNWRLEHYLVWETEHGPVPAGHAIAFINRDRLDTRLENLVCITRQELMARNTVHNLPKPLFKAVQLLGVLKRQIKKREKAREEQDRRPA